MDVEEVRREMLEAEWLEPVSAPRVKFENIDYKAKVASDYVPCGGPSPR